MVDNEGSKTPDECKKYHRDMAAFHMACAVSLDFDLRIVTELYGHNEQELMEMKKFLLLKTIKDDIGSLPKMSPSEKIEEMWIDFLKFPVLYHDFCNKLIEAKSIRDDDAANKYIIIDHIHLSDPINTSETFKKTLYEYNHFFEYSATGELWRNPFSSDNVAVQSPKLASTASNFNTNDDTDQDVLISDNVAVQSPPSAFELASAALNFKTHDDTVQREETSEKRLGYLPKEEEEEDDEIMKWSQKYENSNKKNHVKLKATRGRPRRSISAPEKRGRSDSVTYENSIRTAPEKRGRSDSVTYENSIRTRTRSNSITSQNEKQGDYHTRTRTRSNSITSQNEKEGDYHKRTRTRSNSINSVSSSEVTEKEVVITDANKKKKKLIVAKDTANKKREDRKNNDNFANNGKIVAEKHLYYCNENDTCVKICSSWSIDCNVDELIRLNSPYRGVKLNKRTKFKAGTALRINDSVENPGSILVETDDDEEED